MEEISQDVSSLVRSLARVGTDETKSALLTDLKRTVETGQVDLYLAYKVLKEIEFQVKTSSNVLEQIRKTLFKMECYLFSGGFNAALIY